MTNHSQGSGEEEGAAVDGQNSSFPLITQTNYLCSSTGSLELAEARELNMRNLLDFESRYRKPEDNLSVKEIVKTWVLKKWKKCSAKGILSKNFPTLSALQGYNVREDLPSDAIAGLTVGITMIPQGMAFAYLSTLPPIVGLYISLFASLAYFFLGTSRQLSWGCVAVLSILMADILYSYETKVKAALGIVDDEGAQSLTSTLSPVLNTTEGSTVVGILNSTLSDPVNSELAEALSDEKKIEVAGAVTLISGIILAVLGKLGLGRVTSFMSDALITSFTVGVSFHVITSQIKTVLGLHIPRQNGIFKLIKMWILMLSDIHHTNPATVIVSLVCIVVLYTVKRFVNEKYKKKLRVPIPIELIVVIIATVIFTYTGLSEKYSVNVVKEIKVGVPSPRIPNLALGTDYVVEGLVIIIVSFTQNVAMAKLMGLKHGYRIDANQEMFACGMVSVVCSFFSGYISGPSVSRSLVQDGAGGRTQVASLFAAGLVLVVIMLIGPYFYYLPMCVLAAIIMVNLRSMFLKIATVPALWRKSRADALVWIITCTATVFLQTDVGLLVGIMACILFVLMRSQISAVDVVSEVQAGKYGVWRSEKKYLGGRAIDGVKVVRINSALYFANAEIVTDQVFKQTGVNPVKIKRERSVEVKVDVDNKDENGAALKTEIHGSNGIMTEREPPVENSDVKSNIDQRVDHQNSTQAKPDTAPFSSLIVDLSSVPFVDVMGVQAMEFLITKYQAAGINVYYSNAQEKCVNTLQKTGFLNKHGDIVFLSTDAAVEHAMIVDRA